MSRLKHYKGEDWEIKIKYDEDMGMVLWNDRCGEIPYYLPYSEADQLISKMNQDRKNALIYSQYVFNHLTKHLDNLTKPKIITERTFDNPNFKIKIWETEDKVGAETIWIKEGFKWNTNINDLEFARDISIDKEETTELFVENIYPYFGMSGTKSDIHKSEINYTFTDLCKALERAEQQTSKLTYDTVVKELEGLEEMELYEAMKKYEYSYVLEFWDWFPLTRLSIQFFSMREAVERGLIKLRRAK
jgi:G:T-mismatch repair DNA endonuclease (very short patch repair protein)